MPSKKSPLFRTVQRSHVDLLAQKLSALTGSKFEVLRRRETYSSSGFQDSIVTRYFLRATHQYEHTFGGYRGFTVSEMKYYLASLCDLIQMDFVPVRHTEAKKRRMEKFNVSG